MHLLALIFGVLLLPNAHGIKCYHCAPDSSGTCTDTTIQCSSPSHQCAAQRILSYAGNSKVSDVSGKACAFPGECIEGSINFGVARTVLTTKCCTSDLCNTQNPPDPNKGNPNGKKCFLCDGQNCAGTLNCLGDEDHCISSIVTVGNEKMTMKGCASRQICSNLGSTQISRNFGTEISCCQGDLCNGASSTTAGLLLLVAPLMSLVILS